MDGRGTGYKGEKYMQQVYKKLGVYEAEDALLVGKWILQQTFSKKKHLSLWGWSYGGYASIKTYLQTHLEENRNIFRYIISGAPVTDWKFYDTAYTERYMLTPNQNQNGYKDSSCLEIPSNFTKSTTKLILIHGTADDNVHSLNSFHFMRQLQLNDITFDTMIYPDESHSIIRSGSTSKQLQKSIADKLIQGIYDR